VVSRYRQGYPEKTCPQCGALFRKPTPFCCRRCSSKWRFACGLLGSFGQPGPRSVNYTGRKVLDRGYVMIYVGHDHPMAHNGGYAYEHRVVMAEKLGRPLRSHEFVHHRNGIRGDNRADNLDLVERALPYGSVVCPKCGAVFHVH